MFSNAFMWKVGWSFFAARGVAHRAVASTAAACRAPLTLMVQQ
jgi:hypothetical protein